MTRALTSRLNRVFELPLLTLALTVPLPIPGQDAIRTQPDPAAIQRGRETYVQKCGFCHGVNARGGSEAPDLVRSLMVLGDERGVELGAFPSWIA